MCPPQPLLHGSHHLEDPLARPRSSFLPDRFQPVPSGGPRRLPGLLVLAFLPLLLAACAVGASPSYDPAAPCAGADEQRAADFYPDLEAALPSALDGAPPKLRDSGRYCSPATLGTLSTAGLSEVHFAGASWETGDGRGVSAVVYRAPGLTTDLLADAFTAAAAKATAVSQIKTDQLTIAGRRAVRIRVNNQDHLQTVVFWPAEAADTVNAVLAAESDDAHLQQLINAFGTR